MKITTPLFSVIALGIAGTAHAATYAGNGGTGFGGPIGGSILSIIENGANIDFSLAAGANFNSNVLVLYIDSTTGGDNNTSGYTDISDGGRTAISGLSGGGRTLVNFAAGFGADFALTLQPGTFSGTYNLSTPSNFGFVQDNVLAGSGSGPFTFSVLKTSLGLPASGVSSFNFVGTLISDSGYRSNETIGTSTTIPGTPGDAPNGGFTGTQTFTTFNTVTIPEPSALSLLGLAGLAVASRRKR